MKRAHPSKTTPGMTEKQVWEILDTVKDPEIPVISIVEMGLVQKVEVDDTGVRVVLTPTFSGCPALDVIREETQQALEEAGAGQVEVQYTNDPPWTSEWITAEGRRKLKEFGLAPPPRHTGNIELIQLDTAACPYCGSQNTSLKNSFGPTLCRAIFYCNECRQPFEQFKPL